jgi:hypothetical protein
MIYRLEDDQIVEFNDQYVEYFYSYFIPTNCLIVHDFARLKNIELPAYILYVIIDCTNPVNVEQMLSREIYLSKPYYVLSGLYKYHKSIPENSKIQFFPFWVLWASSPYAPAIADLTNTFSNVPKKYKVSCLNGTQWEHRKLTYLLLSERDYFNDMVFTFNQRPHHGILTEELSLTIEETDKFQRLPPEVAFVNTDNVIGIDLSINHPAYQEAYINLVTETTVNNLTPMLSEKTFKPIIAGQLFVLIASPGAIQFLRDIGIDTFDDIIDHSYDQIEDTKIRIQRAVEEVDRLVKLDLTKLYDQLRIRLIKNSVYYRSPEFRSQFKLNFD